jgi:hypothetical protein
MNGDGSGFAVEDIVGTIKGAIKRANVSTDGTGSDLRVTSFGLTLKVVATTKGGGGLEFRVPFIGMKLKFGASVTAEDTHSIDMTLVPPDLLEEEQSKLRGVSVEDNLVSAIETIRSVVVAAAQGDDPFSLKNGTVEISFVITKEGNISLGVEGELKGEVTHTLRLGLGSNAALKKINLEIPALPEG